MELENLESGDRILFEGRKQPLKVLSTEDRVKVEGPHGAEYLIWKADNGKLLYAQEGKERYASYLENLRKVGVWKREGDRWYHTDTDKQIEIVRGGTGFWTIETEPDDLVEKPLYGYTDKEEAEKDVEKFIGKNPEG